MFDVDEMFCRAISCDLVNSLKCNRYLHHFSSELLRLKFRDVCCVNHGNYKTVIHHTDFPDMVDSFNHEK